MALNHMRGRSQSGYVDQGRVMGGGVVEYGRHVGLIPLVLSAIVPLRSVGSDPA